MAVEAGDPTADPAAGSVLGRVHGKIRSRLSGQYLWIAMKLPVCQ